MHADVASPEALARKTFDGVGCSFGLSDMDDLDGAVTTVARVLRPGILCLLAAAPVFSWMGVEASAPSWAPERGYYDEGWRCGNGPADGLRPEVGANHRMLSTYLNTLMRHSLVVEEVVEPMPEPESINDAPSIGPVPMMDLALETQIG